MAIMSASLALHTLAAVVWVGGMAFVYIVLRLLPTRLSTAPASGNLAIVWLAMAVLLITGYHIIFAVLDGFDAAGLYIHIMNGLGILMMLIFAHL